MEIDLLLIGAALAAVVSLGFLFSFVFDWLKVIQRVGMVFSALGALLSVSLLLIPCGVFTGWAEYSKTPSKLTLLTHFTVTGDTNLQSLQGILVGAVPCFFICTILLLRGVIKLPGQKREIVKPYCDRIRRAANGGPIAPPGTYPKNPRLPNLPRPGQ